MLDIEIKTIEGVANFNMVETFKRHKFVLLILSSIVIITLLLLTITLQKPEKIPSKGVFVIREFYNVI